MAKRRKQDEIITKIQRWKKESEDLSSWYYQRWAKNIKLKRGIWSEDESSESVVRGRSKIFFRKTWATTWRILAAFNNAFLREKDVFRVEGRMGEDVYKAELLQKMVEYRRDLMMRKNSLFLQFLWCFMDILDLGLGAAKFGWKYNENTGQDGPDFQAYPPEQVFLDLNASTKDTMRYVIFENYMSREEMEELGYENIDKAQTVSPSSNIVRQARYYGNKDPMQNPQENEYPAPGSYDEGEREPKGNRYRVLECFYREKGLIRMCVTDGDSIIFKQPEDSPYGDRYPLIMGTCLTDAHKIIGEGFHEPLEGPQESYNANLNMRKDNVALVLNRQTIVSKYGGVDLDSLINSRPGGITVADDVNAVKERDMRDVTQSSYMEAAADEAMMQEMSGITPTHQGMSMADKATVAQINLSEGNAKIDLYISIVGETFVRDFYSHLAWLIQKFETDETVFRIANDSLREKVQIDYGEDIFDIEFEADCIVNIGLGATGKETKIRQTMLAMDRAIMANQALIPLLQSGLVPPEGIRLFDTTRFMEDLLPELGRKNVDDYFINIDQSMLMQQAQAEGQGGGAGGQLQLPGGAEMNELQAGGLGGF